MVGSSYHQTQGFLSSDQVESYEGAAKKQEDVVLAVFRRQPSRELSPEDVHRMALHDAPLTSVRRAITNLTRKGLLVRTEGSRAGNYGRQVGLWRLADHQLRLF